jgi:hypothetical protein
MSFPVFTELKGKEWNQKIGKSKREINFKIVLLLSCVLPLSSMVCTVPVQYLCGVGADDRLQARAE